MFKLLHDEQVLPAVIELAEGARRRLVLVSPYNDFSVNLSNAVEQAAQRVSVSLPCAEAIKTRKKRRILIG